MNKTKEEIAKEVVEYFRIILLGKRLVEMGENTGLLRSGYILDGKKYYDKKRYRKG